VSYRCFEVEVRDKVAHVVLSRGDELNTMVPEFWTELPHLVDTLSDSGEVRALVMSSTGRHFSAGMDLAVFGGLTADSGVEAGRRHATLRLLTRRLQDAFASLERARMPVLVAIHGGCIGGALDMVCAADLRYATADAFFVVQETNIGITADLGTLQRLPKLVPDGVVRELAFTGRRLPAARAREVGLVNEVYADRAQLLSAVVATAHEIADNSPLTVWGAKEMLTYARDHPVADALDRVATWQAGMFQPTDVREALAARGARRPAAYDDLPPAPRGL
jgi:enoyl-CoA hydratase